MSHAAQDRCGDRWPLLEPNEEDMANGTMHQCRFFLGHSGGHQCFCGARPEGEQ
jgi:hypothetical protein